ncbi:MFS general substrate transporter [Cutaneotrichosporon oleaginosum]|uniref:MFS general substrate transporter n=1 Tax=Cutaneotrichosporon oleaginosum TaxID=879819 RepID=A0A0J1B9K7_9TREE|nr:MFS general substrate transporter [Cutaneotrichosporon oleaginosum]KLT44529.1 MFS general substrate transporter [Cutaneotrichosporon oleaginosum]TXT13955.1 hypothetical protein COLE_00148 [Cutaneotrichosporon oleaginosum]
MDVERITSDTKSDTKVAHVEDEAWVDPQAERRLLWKMDMHLVPILWVMWTFSNLDRSNIGNAYAGGMKESLNMSSTDYSVALLVFFIGYVVFEIPSNMILVHLRPSIYLPAIMFWWGGVAIALAACKNTPALAGVRVILGLAESGFAPGVLYLLSTWYKKKELARRYTLFWLGTPVSGMVGGILAGAIIERMDGISGLHGWQWLFVIEGIATCVIAVAAVFILPDYPTTTRWLSEEEKELIVRRLSTENLNTTGEHLGHMESLRLAFQDWRTYLFLFLYAMATGAMTITYFIPTLVKGLGYSGSQTQYMTAPIYAVGIVIVLIVCFTSDWLGERGFYVVAAGLIGATCFAVIMGVTNKVVQYVFLCFGLASIFSSVPTLLVWASNEVSHPREKRAIVQAAMNVAGNLASIYGAFLWPAADAPRYFTGWGCTLAFVFTMSVVAFTSRMLFKKHPYPTA